MSCNKDDRSSLAARDTAYNRLVASYCVVSGRVQTMQGRAQTAHLSEVWPVVR